ncbi:hypothetical protein GCM10009633_32400 [Janibacter melonis]
MLGSVWSASDGDVQLFPTLAQGLLWANLAVAGAVRARRIGDILGSDPEEPVEQVMARAKEVNAHDVFPALAIFDATCAVLVLLLAPAVWPLAAAASATAVLFAVAWWRARRRGDHDSAVVDPPSARR